MTKLLGSRGFYFGILGFFIFEALWIALSSVYPMAFDEDFHLGVIRLYADNFWPVLPEDAGSSGVFGAVARDPSFLFHWLMSFPYRLIGLFTDSQTATVIILRLINIALFAYGLALFHRFMRQMGRSAAFSNVALMLFVLIPVVPLLAGQINYDNLLMVFVAWIFLLVAKLCKGFKEHQIDARAAAALVLVSGYASIVKYAFLPIAAMAVLFCLVAAIVSFKKRYVLLKALKRSYKTLGTGLKVALAALFVVGLGLFIQRYGVNVARYGTPLPDCGAVLSVNQCINYGPWGRDYVNARDKGPVDDSSLLYTAQWLQGLHTRLFFMVNGPHQEYKNYPPPPILANTATVLAVFSFVAAGFYARRILRENPILGLILAASAVYLGALWLTNYTTFLKTGEPVAINGRYLIPILLPLAAVAGAALSRFLRGAAALKPYLAVLVILLFLQAGGVFSFIIRSDSTWYWQSGLVNDANNAVRGLVDPLMVEGSQEFDKYSID